MTSLLRKLLTSAALGLTLTLSASADQLYLRNKPFAGSVLGTGSDLTTLKIELRPALEALGWQVWSSNGSWFAAPTRGTEASKAGAPGHLQVNGRDLTVTDQGGLHYVNLEELAAATGFEVLYNRSAGTVDVALARTADSVSDSASLAAGYRLIAFLSKKSAPCDEFRPTLAKMEELYHLPVVYVDCDSIHSHDYRLNIKYFQGSDIPYTVLLNSRNKVLKSWTGAVQEPIVEADVKQALSSERAR